jgi:hypothetical protein
VMPSQWPHEVGGAPAAAMHHPPGCKTWAATTMQGAPAPPFGAHPWEAVRPSTRSSPPFVRRSASDYLRFQSSHGTQGLPPGGIIYQSQWCFQNVLRLWEVLAASGEHDMSSFVIIYLTLPPQAPGHWPCRFVRAGHSCCSSARCCAVGGPEPATFSMRLGNGYVPTECKPCFTFHVALATLSGRIYDLDQADSLWGANFEAWIQHLAWIEHPCGVMEQAVGRVQFRFLEHPMHRRCADLAMDSEYFWEAESPEISCGERPLNQLATHLAPPGPGSRHSFHSAITFARPPVVLNVVAAPSAKARIDAANAWPTRGDSYNLDCNLDISGTFGAAEFRAKLAILAAVFGDEKYESRWPQDFKGGETFSSSPSCSSSSSSSTSSSSSFSSPLSSPTANSPNRPYAPPPPATCLWLPPTSHASTALEAYAFTAPRWRAARTLPGASWEARNWRWCQSQQDWARY